MYLLSAALLQLTQEEKVVCSVSGILVCLDLSPSKSTFPLAGILQAFLLYPQTRQFILFCTQEPSWRTPTSS